MFVRAKKSGPYQYLQVVENRREGTKVVQRVISTLGRLDRLNAKGDIESLVRSLSRFSEQALLVLSGKSDLLAEARKIGPALIFERLWEELGIGRVLKELLKDRLFGFDVERAVFLTVLHRLMVSGSDRYCEKWRRDYVIRGTDDLSLHHLYRAMAFLGEEVVDQADATPFSPRCTKDLVEEHLFHGQRHLFQGLDLVFFDTTSLYFEGEGGETLGEKGYQQGPSAGSQSDGGRGCSRQSRQAHLLRDVAGQHHGCEDSHSDSTKDSQAFSGRPLLPGGRPGDDQQRDPENPR